MEEKDGEDEKKIFQLLMFVLLRAIRFEMGGVNIKYVLYCYFNVKSKASIREIKNSVSRSRYTCNNYFIEPRDTWKIGNKND